VPYFTQFFEEHAPFGSSSARESVEFFRAHAGHAGIALRPVDAGRRTAEAAVIPITANCWRTAMTGSIRSVRSCGTPRRWWLRT